MRDIKFRAWDGEAMYTQEDIGDDYDFVIGSEQSLALTVNQQFHECGSGVAEEYWQYVAVNAEFMQFTGLTDKNGVDIYEGGIVSGFNGELIGVIEWCNDDCMYWIKTKSGGGQLTVSYIENFEIIGNIHQHPELLEK